jgi:hypothetical protein
MLLEDRNATIYEAGVAISGVAAREGASVLLAHRTLAA